ncbi:hypothetical protein [Nostoc sp. MS1]|uniref:hypothetical protein n=1 Tax=Nostoc sp. MS1 TaxID=2764711 RepID=UPI001CC68786|nr:hypothetical protein [Nostoc sp. MS1]BCL37273.1 hypothetical protein NSMS1_37200 [Nostoc sp. MS1]
MLADDIQKHSHNTQFIILTDKPAEFKQYSHVQAFYHRLQSVKGYHDKRFVLQKALELYDTCIFLDSDVRILSTVSADMEFLPGITARAGCNILKHNNSDQLKQKKLPLFLELSQKLSIDLENTGWLHEFMFTLKKDHGKEIEFLKLWGEISKVFELQGIYNGEGSIIGLASAASGLTIRYDSHDRFLFFKDIIEKVRIQKCQSQANEKQHLFDIHRSIEYPQRSVWEKGTDKLIKKTVFMYRLLRLKFITSQEDFLN